MYHQKLLAEYEARERRMREEVDERVGDSSNKLRLLLRGFAKKEKIQKIRDYYGSGWVGPGLTRNFFFLVENRPKVALNQWLYFGVVYHVYSVCICIVKTCWLILID